MPDAAGVNTGTSTRFELDARRLSLRQSSCRPFRSCAIQPMTARKLSDDDLRSVFAYLRTIPAVKNDVPDTTVPLELQTAIARANERIVSGK